MNDNIIYQRKRLKLEERKAKALETIAKVLVRKEGLEEEFE